ncbi:MAG: DMT family transporter [Rhodospirillales bacterium]
MSLPLSAPMRAALWVFGATLSFCAMAVSGREAGRALSTADLLTWRALIGIVVMTAAAAFMRGGFAQLRTQRIGLHITRNLFHFFGQYGWYAAVTMIPLAQVFALEFTSPIWAMLAAPLLLGERFTRWKTLAAVMGFTGVLLIVKPGAAEISPGTAWAFFAAFGFAGTIIATKRLTSTESTLCILFYLTVIQAPLGMIISGGLPALPAGPDAAQTWMWTAVLALCGLNAHLCLTRAFRLADATVVAPLDYMRLPMIAVLGFALYGETLDMAVIAGGVLIVFGNVMNIRAEGRRARARLGPPPGV